MKKSRLKYYIGHKKGKGFYDTEIFTSRKNPTEASHGHKYGYVIGPFTSVSDAKRRGSPYGTAK
jgi:hypothetical protein